MDKLQTNLSQLTLRNAALSDKHAAAQAALAEAIAARDRHHLEGDIADETTADKFQAKVDHYNSTVAGLDAALGTLQKQIADAEQQLAAERSAVERKAAAEKLSADLDAVERALPIYLDAARRFTKALDELHFHFEAGQMSAFVTNGLTQVEVAAAFTLAELRGTVKGVADGTMPIPAAKPVPAPVATVEPPPQTRRVFCMKSIKWRDADGRQRAVMQYEDAELPLSLADRALRISACVAVTDERRKALKGAHGGRHPNVDATDIVDLDSVTDYSDARHSNFDPALRAAEFRVIDRSSEERRISIPAQRAG